MERFVEKSLCLAITPSLDLRASEMLWLGQTVALLSDPLTIHDLTEAESREGRTLQTTGTLMTLTELPVWFPDAQPAPGAPTSLLWSFNNTFPQTTSEAGPRAGREQPAYPPSRNICVL